MSTPTPPPSLSDYNPPLPASGSAGSAGPARRPRTVTVAAALLVLQAIVGLVGIAVSFSYRDVLREDMTTAEVIARHLAGEPTNISLLGVGCSVLLAVIFLALAALVLRRSNPARIAAWVISVLGVCIGARILYSSPAPAKSVPGFYEANTAVWNVFMPAVVIYVAIVVLLTLRSSSDYFAKRPA